MGRKPRERKPGTRDWQVRILDMPEDQIAAVKIIALQRVVNLGDMLREWITDTMMKETEKHK